MSCFVEHTVILLHPARKDALHPRGPYAAPEVIQGNVIYAKPQKNIRPCDHHADSDQTSRHVDRGERGQPSL